VSAEPTAKQLAVLVFVSSYIQTHRHAPSLREIATAIGVVASSARVHLKFLEKKGLVSRAIGISRGLSLTGAGIDAVRAIDD